MDETRSLILCIDVEPSGRAIDPSESHRQWDYLPEFLDRIAELRAALASRTRSRVHFSWFLRIDPQMEKLFGSAAWVIQQNADLIQELGRQGDEIGLHPHPFRWIESKGIWSNDVVDLSWIRYCIKMSAQAYSDATGRKAESFRFGDRWLDDSATELLEEIGIRYDLTIEPGHRSTSIRQSEGAGSLPDYRRAPTKPYQPAVDDFLSANGTTKRAIWMIPLSTFNRWTLFHRPPFLKRKVATVNLGYRPQIMQDAMRRILRSPQNRIAVFAVRSGDYADVETSRSIRENFSFLANEVENWNVDTPAEAIGRIHHKDTEHRGGAISKCKL